MAAVIDRFVAKTRRSNNGCVEWTGGKDERGYGMFWDGHRTIRAHQASFSLFVGDRNGLCVLHRCDNPACVSPTHLWLGTNHDNVLDMHAKRRHYHTAGEANGRSKLTVDQVKSIRDLYQPRKMGYARLAVIFGVQKRTIKSIVSRDTWKLF